MRAPARAPAVLPASQIQRNVGVHRVTPQHRKSSALGITPGTHLRNPSPAAVSQISHQSTALENTGLTDELFHSSGNHHSLPHFLS